MTDSRDIFCPNGTADPTPVYATRVATTAKPLVGEVWTGENGYRNLVISVHAGHAQTLLMTDNYSADKLLVHVDGRVYYTLPTMISYLPSRRYGERLGQISGDEMAAVRKAVLEGLGGAATDEDGREYYTKYLDAKREADAAGMELARMKAKLDNPETTTRERMLEEHLEAVTADMKFWHRAYDNLLDRIMAGDR